MTAIREDDFPVAVNQKVTAGLIIVILPVVLYLSTLEQEHEILSECRRREQTVPGQPMEVEGPVGTAIRISQYYERPPMMPLVRDKTFGRGKRHHYNGNTPLSEFFLDPLHLSEVLLAG